MAAAKAAIQDAQRDAAASAAKLVQLTGANERLALQLNAVRLMPAMGRTMRLPTCLGRIKAIECLVGSTSHLGLSRI